MTRVFYDDTCRQHTIEIKNGRSGEKYVYIDGKFYCSADTLDEADEEIEEFVKHNSYKTLMEVI